LRLKKNKFDFLLNIFSVIIQSEFNYTTILFLLEKTIIVRSFISLTRSFRTIVCNLFKLFFSQ